MNSAVHKVPLNSGRAAPKPSLPPINGSRIIHINTHSRTHTSPFNIWTLLIYHTSSHNVFIALIIRPFNISLLTESHESTTESECWAQPTSCIITTQHHTFTAHRSRWGATGPRRAQTSGIAVSLFSLLPFLILSFTRITTCEALRDRKSTSIGRHMFDFFFLLLLPYLFLF